MATNRPKLKFLRGSTYTFDVSDASLAAHPLKFTADSGSTEYTTGVTLTGTQGQAGAEITFVVPNYAPVNLNYYCGTHGMGMGNHIFIPASLQTSDASSDPNGWNVTFNYPNYPTGGHNWKELAVSPLKEIYGIFGNQTSGKVQLTKIDANGSHQWTAGIGGRAISFQPDVAAGVDVDNDNNPIIAAAYYSHGNGIGDFGNSPPNNKPLKGLVLKATPAGGTTWVKLIEADEANENQWDDFHIASMTTNNNNDIIVAGTTLTHGAGSVPTSNMPFFIKLNSSGTLVSAKAFGNLNFNQSVTNIVDDSDRNIYIAGWTKSGFNTGSTDLTNAYMSKRDSNGNNIWSKAYRTSGIPAGQDGYTNFCQDVDVGADGHPVFVGYASNGDRPSFITKLDKDNGNIIWQKTGPDQDAFYRVAIDKTNNLNFVTEGGDFGGFRIYDDNGLLKKSMLIRGPGDSKAIQNNGGSYNDLLATMSNSNFITGGSYWINDQYQNPRTWVAKFPTDVREDDWNDTDYRLILAETDSSGTAGALIDMNVALSNDYTFNSGNNFNVRAVDYTDSTLAFDANFVPSSSTLNPLTNSGPGLMGTYAYTVRTSNSPTDKTWTPSAISFGTDPGAIKFDAELDFSSAPNNPSMPKSPVWGADGTKLFYLAGGAFTNTMQVFQFDVSRPYDITSIDSSTSGSILDLNKDSDFHNIWTNEPYSGAHDENNPNYLWFKPDGTKMYLTGNAKQTVIQYALDSAWNIMGGRTAEHKIGSGALNLWTQETIQNNWVYDSDWQIINWGSYEWLDSGSSLVSSWANDRGASIKQTFSTPYDISTITSSFASSSIVDHVHTVYIDSDGDGALWSQRVRKLGAANGGQFNHDGTERYFLQGVWMDSAFDDPNIGNGNATMRVSLVKATLSTPYDIETMTYHSQVELTNLPGSSLHSTRPNGTLSFHPDGSKLYFMSSSDNIGGTDVWDRARLFQFSSTGDSAGSVFITEPDISVKPYIQYVPPLLSYGDRGVFFGGFTTPTSNVINDIEYITISSTGNATDFGNLANATTEAAGCSNQNRGLIMGRKLSNGDADGSIDYITISTTGNAQSFGDLSQARYYSAGLSDGTYGLTVGGKFDGSGTWSNTYGNVIDRVTIATTGDASDFGDTTVNCYNCYGVQDATRGVYSLATTAISGSVSARQDKSTEYITMATSGNATYFGEMYQRGFRRATGSDATRGVFAQGYNGSYGSNNIEYLTIQTTGNSSDFGDALDLASSPAGTSNGTRMVMAGGSGPPPNYTRYNRIGYVTIQTTGNASDFGNLTKDKGQSNGFSGDA